MNKIYINNIFRNVFVIFILIILWTILSVSTWADEGANRMWFAGIGEVFNAMVDIFTTKLIHIYSSFILIFKSTIIVVILGVLLGIIVGFFDTLYKSLNWSIDFWRSIPPIIMIGILVNMDGTDELYWRIWLVVFGSLPIMIMQIADAINGSSKSRMLIFQSIDTGFYFKIRNVLIYEILPSLFSTTRTVISFAIIIVIVSEMVYAPVNGIGEQIIHFQTASELQYVYAYAIIVGLIGFLLNELFRYVERKVVVW